MFAALQQLPDGVAHAFGALDGLDRCFLTGFARLGDEQLSALEALKNIFSGTPLGEAIAAGVGGLASGSFDAAHFVAVAAGRAALNGAVHDALLAQVRAALGRPQPPAFPAPAAPQLSESAAAQLESARQWLTELALAGFGQLDAGSVVPFAAALEPIQADPALARQALVLTGLLNELAAALPIDDPEGLPLARWADIWTRAMLGTLGAAPAPEGEAVSGTLYIFGADIRRHGNAFSAVGWGVLDGDGGARAVRFTRTGWKVDLAVGDEGWDALGDKHDELRNALERRQPLRVAGATLLPTGDLLLDTGKPMIVSKPFDVDQQAAPLAPGQSIQTPVAAPADRHPVQIAEPVYLTGYAAVGGKGKPARLSLDGAELEVNDARNPLDSQALINKLPGSHSMVGLLRFDGGAWSLQPLSVRDVIKGKAIDTWIGEKALSSKSTALSTLRERAGKMLRTKS
jgi:hypothetical protein